MEDFDLTEILGVPMERCEECMKILQYPLTSKDFIPMKQIALELKDLAQSKEEAIVFGWYFACVYYSRHPQEFMEKSIFQSLSDAMTMTFHNEYEQAEEVSK